MAFDAQLLFRDGSTDLTATMAGSYVAIGEQTDSLVCRIIVPEMAETNDKIVATITMSDDGTNAKEVITLPDITKALVAAGKYEYFSKILPARAYAKLTLTVTDADSGGDFDAGAVIAGLVPASRYNVA